MTNKCPIAIFFEKHTDYAAAKTISISSKYLKKSGYTVYLNEDPQSVTFNAAFNSLKMASELSLSQAHQYGIDHNHLKSFKQSYELFKKIKKLGLDFYSIDLLQDHNIDTYKWQRGEYNDKRHDAMVENIDEICTKHNSGMIFLVGLAHAQIVNLLKDRGYDKIDTFYSYSQDQIADQRDLSKNAKVGEYVVSANPEWRISMGLEDITLIDLRDYSDAATIREEVKCQISGECMDNHDEI